MNEILAGIVPAEDMDEEPLEETSVDGQPEWVVSVETRPVERTGLLAVRVTVLEKLADGAEDAPVKNQLRRQFTLVRWIRAPRDAASSARGAAATADSQTPAVPFGGGSQR